MVSEEPVNNDGEPFGTAFGKKVIIVHSVFGSAQQLYPLLYLT